MNLCGLLIQSKKMVFILNLRIIICIELYKQKNEQSNQKYDFIGENQVNLIN